MKQLEDEIRQANETYDADYSYKKNLNSKYQNSHYMSSY